MNTSGLIVSHEDPILITGSNGFIGVKVVETLLSQGFTNLSCFVRPTSNLARLNAVIASFKEAHVKLLKGNLLSSEDCKNATEGIKVIYHLAAGIEKTFPGSFMNSVVTTKNLLEASLQNKNFKRFLNVSSFAVYSNMKIKRGGLLDETCEVESLPHRRHEPYCFAKTKQDELVLEYNQKYEIPYVIVRPGAVFGPGKAAITPRVGIGTFGIFLHLGGSNVIPLTYVDNCAEAIVLAGIVNGIDGEIFNIVDDVLPKSRNFLNMYKKEIGHFRSLYIPYSMFFFLCYLWEKYSTWSKGQLPPVFNRIRCSAYWKGNRYSNKKLKDMTGWSPQIPYDKALQLYFEYCKNNGANK